MVTASTSTRLSIKNILFTTDFSATSEAAIPYAQAFARWYDAKVFIGHALGFQPFLRIPMEPLPADFDLLQQDAQRHMHEFICAHPMQEIRYEALMEQGELLPVISDFMDRYQIDFIVLGTHGREGFKKLILGSTAEQIFRFASCPVLTIGPKALHSEIGFECFKKILFATDFSAACSHALPYALSIAEENQAHLLLLHLAPLIPMQDRDLESQIKRRMKSLLPEDCEAWCTPEFEVRHEFPAEGILASAQEFDADLIVMGVHKSEAPKAAAHLPWTIAYEVVCNVHCPVLTVRG